MLPRSLSYTAVDIIGHHDIAIKVENKNQPKLESLGRPDSLVLGSALQSNTSLVTNSSKTLLIPESSLLPHSLSHIAIKVDVDENKNQDKLESLGGPDSLVLGLALQSNIRPGINDEQTNTYTRPPSKTLIHFVKEPFTKLTTFILLGSATLYLLFGIKDYGLKQGWYEGGTLFLGIFFSLAVSSFSNFKLNKQFDILSDMMSRNISCDTIEQTDQLQSRVNKIASMTRKLGLLVAYLILLVRYLTGPKDESGKVVGAAGVTMIVVVIPVDGSPLSLTLAWAYSIQRKMKDQAMLRNLSACKTMALKEADIVILDDSSASVRVNIQKFIQFQLTVNVTALMINLVAAIAGKKAPLTAVQSLWVNLIMDSFGALALVTEEPIDDDLMMKKKPIGKDEPLITNQMWRNLLVQAFYQISMLLMLQFRGRTMENTLIFNTFVFCQVFNMFNSRSMEKKNVFKGILKNRFFVGSIVMTVVLQVLMVDFLKRFVAGTERLNWDQWVVCVVIAAASCLLGWLVKFVPVRRDISLAT